MFRSFRTPDPRSLVVLRQSVRQFLDAELQSGSIKQSVNSWMVHDRSFSERCAAAGFVGMTLPVIYGGQNRSQVERHVVVEELLAAGAPLAAHWIADRQSGPQIAKHGSVRMRSLLLPEIAAGRCCFAIGMSEPDVGSDLAAVRTKAEKVDGGWRIVGSKLWTSNADKADWLIALCRTSPAGESRHDGLTQFLIDLRREGVTVRPVENIAGDLDFCEVHFDGYVAAEDEVLGEPSQGWKLVMQELASERSGPDRYLSTYPLLAAALANGIVDVGRVEDVGGSIVRLAALQAMSLSVATAIASGAPAELDAVMVKDAGTSFEQEVPEIIRKVCGTHSLPVSVETALERSIVYAPSFSLRGGTREILRGIIARGVGLR